MTEQQQAAMRQALEALEKLADAADGFNVSGVYFNEELWGKECLGDAYDAITALRQALEQQPADEPGYTTTRNSWTGRATHKCNSCGKDDFRSEHAAKFHECETLATQPDDGVHQFRKRGCADWHDGYADHEDGKGPYEERTLYTRPQPAAQWVGLTFDEENDLWESTDSDWELMKRVEAKLREKNGGGA